MTHFISHPTAERRRAELESRIEKTEARRLAHLNRYKKQPKGLIQESTETQPVKKSSWSVLLKLFYELNLPRSSSSDTWLSFHAISQLIHQAKVVVLTTKVLNTALKQADDESRRLDARVLLTSYLVLMCPKEIFQNVEGEDEKVSGRERETKRLIEFGRHYIILPSACCTCSRPG